MTATHDSILKVDRRGRICDSAEQRSALCHEWWRGSGGCNSVGGGESDSLAGQHGGQASQKVFEINAGQNVRIPAALRMNALHPIFPWRPSPLWRFDSLTALPQSS